MVEPEFLGNVERTDDEMDDIEMVDADEDSEPELPEPGDMDLDIDTGDLDNG